VLYTGTVTGGGYNCWTGKFAIFEGSPNGLWNKISAHSDWIKEAMEENRETIVEENHNRFVNKEEKKPDDMYNDGGGWGDVDIDWD
jgi:hypothetical protein